MARSAQTQAEALRLLRELQRQAEQGLVSAGRPPTVAQFMTQWLARQRHALRPRTWEGYESIARTRLTPQLGRLRLDQLSPAHLAAAYDRLRGLGLSAKSVLNSHRLLHRALGDAVHWGMLARNPCELVDPPQAARPAVRALD